MYCENLHNTEETVNLKILIILIAISFLLPACASVATSSPTATNEPVEAEEIETEAAVKVQPEADECLACHTDKQRLIDTAAQVEDHESESTGVG